jgi:hypothetical protein
MTSIGHLATSTLLVRSLPKAEGFVRECPHVRCLQVRFCKVKFSGDQALVTKNFLQVFQR